MPPEPSRTPSPDTAARALATTHQSRATRGARDRVDQALRLLDWSSLARGLERTRKRVQTKAPVDPAAIKATEWFLDNYYFLRRVARQVTEDLPPRFLRRLPRLGLGPSAGLARIDAVARALVAGEYELDHDVLRSFIGAYQDVSELTIAELWALPVMLRSALLQALLRWMSDVETPSSSTLPPAPARKDLGEAVGRCVRGLRALSEIDWRDFFEALSRVDAILRQDPGRIYGGMDFDTCDAYRKAVEDLAWATGCAEVDVATRAIDLAAQQPASAGGVGYYLLGEGRDALEALFGYRARGVERVRRAVLSHATLTHLGSLALLTFAPLAVVVACWLAAGVSWERAALAAVSLAIPVSAAAVALEQATILRLLRPRVLPKLDFSAGIPDDARTLVVLPAIVARPEDVVDLLRQIELHRLSNPEPGLSFALLTDDADSTSMPRDTALVDRAAEGIVALNAKHGKDGGGPFLLLHREPRWNAREGRFMGWERKRGKLEELNRLLRGDTQTSYVRCVGDPRNLERIRYVITLDNDTQLPMGTAHRLVGLMAHPLNRAVFDSRSRVVSGYTIVQPRIETSPTDARRTRFAQVFAGDVGYDIYTRACSDLYQDLFGSGIYVGKGIYDVDAFMRSVEDRVPENALVSHDLFEGIHGRVGLATDIVLFEGYPSRYATYARRMQRWIRGDWQLVPWLLPWVPSSQSPRRLANPLRAVDRWKIFDNLRRSLVAPSFVLLLACGWLGLPGALPWTLCALALLGAPVLPAVLGPGRRRGETLARYALGVTFLAHEASVVADAVLRVAARMTTRRRLLEWTSTAHTAWKLGKKSQRAVLWSEMAWSPAGAIALLAIVAWANPSSLFVAGPLLALWFVAPEIAYRVSADRETPRERTVSPDGRKALRRLARRTWLFFETFVGPNDQWLPIDNYQEPPHEQTAHRTSPTNIGMLLLSTLAAYDLGYVGVSALSLRLRRTFESIARLEHHRGHLLNWYETRSLEPLLPRYVSTVDSGNFLGCLLAVGEGCRAAARAQVLRAADWEGLRDALDLVEAVLETAPARSPRAVAAVLQSMRDVVSRAARAEVPAYDAIRELSDRLHAALRRELLGLVEAGAYRGNHEALRALERSSDAFAHQLQQLRREVETLLPWVTLQVDAAALGIDLPTDVRLDEIEHVAASLRGRIAAAAPPDVEALQDAAQRLTVATETAVDQAAGLSRDLLGIAARAEEEARGIDFRLLFDPERRLFHIGYNVTVDRVDSNHYDLLASEARLASYLAIVRRDVPESHWFTLGRPMTSAHGSPALLSWGGTMFEYLMPTILMRSHEGTLLSQSCRHVVAWQIAHARKNGMPWGVSESAYARLDGQGTYQYRSFGVPGLGFKRGLEDDRVVTPYASFLGLSIEPRAVVHNAARLVTMGMLGLYGLREALDLRREHATARHPYAIVRSYMAHHQGMLLVAIDNGLNGGIMIDRFHADAQVRTGEMLLNERPPPVAPTEWPKVDTQDAGAAPTSEVPQVTPWSPDAGRPQALALTNGVLTTLATAAGSGALFWRGLALVAFDPDPLREADGLSIVVRDANDANASPGAGDVRTMYAAHKAEFHRREGGISTHVEIAVAPGDDAELRLVTIRNESDREAELTVTTFGRPALVPAREVATHPAFANLFIESEWEHDVAGLVFTRRARSDDEPTVAVVHRLVGDEPQVQLLGYETDRAALLGPGRDDAVRDPADRASRAPLGRHVGAVLDPVLCLRAGVRLRAKGTATLAFVTTVGSSRAAALSVARRYGSMRSVRWALRDAEPEGRRRVQRAGVGAQLLPAVQRLLSAIVYGDPALGPTSEAVAKGRPCKSELWGRGISGDDPIVLVRVHDAEAPLVRELVAAQEYLRQCDVRMDLVLADEKATGYADDATGALRSVLAKCGAEAWMNRHGGIFVLPLDQLSERERLLLEASARVTLTTRDDSLVARMARPATPKPTLPAFEPTAAEDASPRPVVVPELRYTNGFGGFRPDGREYVIAVRRGKPTPAPWCNVLANAEFGCLVSESSLGCTWALNSRENRLTPWSNDALLDEPSEALYLRDEETAELWSPTPAPAGRGCDTLVSHGAGYTTYARESHGLVQELTVFVPPDASVKVVRLRVRNTRPRPRRLTATYYAEWVLGTQRRESRHYVTTEIDRARACLFARCTWNAEFADRVAFVASERELHGFTADRAEFLGRGGTLASPAALRRWGLSGRVESGGDPCGALQVHLELAPGQEVRTHFVVGQASDSAEARRLVERFRDPSEVDAAWGRVGSFWDELLGAVRVKTPEPAMDLLLNRWLLYQAVSARLFGRTGFYQSSGAFGFRDQLQDVLALIHGAPARARAHILEAASHQFEEGDVLHWWHPPEGRGVRTRCSDDMAWLPFVTSEYVLATGDVSILSEDVPFLTASALRPDERDRYAAYARAAGASLFEHCRRALDRALTRGPQGLPLMGDGDWNDGMNRVGSKGLGESVWLAWFLIATMDAFADVCARVGESGHAANWHVKAGELRRSVEACAWDGGWYLRAFHDDGSRLGSARSRECQIDSITQSWAVLARGDRARATTAIAAVEERLVDATERLLLLLAPPFDTSRHDPGYIRAYPPGIRENGGQYTHAATWLGWAYARLGKGERAERIFRILNPVLRAGTEREATRYRVEPYVLAGDICGVPPFVGRGGWSWYTGAAAWTWRLGVEAILGIRKEGGALCIDPCIPPAWRGFEAWVRHEGREFHVVVENPSGVSTGVASITIDGAPADGPRLQVATPGTHHEVRVRLGAPQADRVTSASPPASPSTPPLRAVRAAGRGT